jgi:hypothetical protein
MQCEIIRKNTNYANDQAYNLHFRLHILIIRYLSFFNLLPAHILDFNYKFEIFNVTFKFNFPNRSIF